MMDVITSEFDDYRIRNGIHKYTFTFPTDTIIVQYDVEVIHKPNDKSVILRLEVPKI